MYNKPNLHDIRLYVAFLTVLAVMAVFFPKVGRFPYDYQEGKAWLHETLFAPFDFPILKPEDDFLAEKAKAAADVVRYYTADNSKVASILASFSTARQNVDSLPESGMATGIVLSALDHIYSSGLVSTFEGNDSDEDVIMVQDGKKTRPMASAELYNVDRAGLYIRTRLSGAFPPAVADSLFKSLNINEYLVPNVNYDEKMTELFHRNAVNDISQTRGVMYAGQLVVNYGQTITDDIARLLDSYKAEYEKNYGFSGSFALLVLGQIILSAVILSLLFLGLLFCEPAIFSSPRKYAFILMIFTLAFALTVMFYRHWPEWFLMVPYSVFALYLVSFFRRRTAFCVYLTMLLPLLLIPANGLQLFIVNASAGAVSILMFRSFSRRWQQFVLALFVMLTLAIVVIAYNFIQKGAFYGSVVGYGQMAVHAVLVPAFLTLVFLFEKVFGLVSTARLRDLSDTGNPLLQELSRKAPGSFQHSLSVASLAEAAARCIGADEVLSRAGALYHDVGKTNNPQCFIENQTPGVIYHDGMTSLQSAHDIIAHVDDGIAMARRYGLPGMITDFISCHHGTSKTMFFYNRYCNEGGDPSQTAPFTYHGSLPVTKEQTVVMMADSIEAAARTLKEYTSDTISELVEKIVSDKVSEGQFDESDITIAETGMVKECFKRELRQMYHARITYPERKAAVQDKPAEEAGK